MKKQSILVTNIQRFSLHDGPGIRTTVFLKGCSLRCPWCSNPENQIPLPQNYTKDGVLGTYGKYYSVSELITECLKDKIFYDGKLNDSNYWNVSSANQIDLLPGGITFSGGEALLQMNMLVPLIKELHKHNIHTVVETCLFAPETNISYALTHIDFFYVDMKIMDDAKCKKIENGDLSLYLLNLDKVLTWTDEAGHHKPVVIRIPVIGNKTDDDNNREIIHKVIEQYRESILKIELIKEHNLAESKYKSLDMKIDYYGVEDSLMEKYKEELRDLGMPIEICKI